MTEDELEARVEQLEADLKERDGKLKDLRTELREAMDLVDQMREQVQDGNEVIERWIEAFEMEVDESGAYRWRPWLDRLCDAHDRLRDENAKLIRDWNRFVGEYNAAIAPRTLGRPLAASETQIAKVRLLKKSGASLRKITSQTGLGLRTVRTIIEKDSGTDRTSKRTNEVRRRELDRLRAAEWRARKRSIDDLPKKISETVKRGGELVKAAKGLGKG